jgi:2-polyprenyl-6-methoxyphenol hydroxylase-like FAD-dependent oxidoreductase
MKVTIVGGGPAGLFLALLLKRRGGSRFAVDVLDQNPSGATYGFGVVLSEHLLPRLKEVDRAFFEDLQRASYVTRHQIIRHNDVTLFLEGGAFGAAIARLELLAILQRHCERAGVSIHHGKRVDDPTQLEGDLVVGADGVRSVVRAAVADPLGATSRTLTNRVAWYGTKKHFPYPTLAFKGNEHGHFVAAAYPYTETLSTFVAECDDATWTRSGLGVMTDDARQAFAERIFAEELEGHPLLSNKSTWGPLLATRSERWSHGRYVLVGDALHSAHPTIGSGTRLAMDDALALGDALTREPDDRERALAIFRASREPAKQRLIAACDRSIAWYERFGEKLDALEPTQFVFDFMTRTGRLTEERLFDEFPAFMERHADDWQRFQRSRADDGPREARS